MKYIELENNFRIYDLTESCIFKKNTDEFGGLSNMSTSFKIRVNNLSISSVEALYQACKFPEDFDIQQRILMESSPFTVKLLSKKGIEREDWLSIRVKVMKWCLKLKLAQNYYGFGELLSSTFNKNIVEFTKNDQFWGAKKLNENQLIGKNVLGRLLMELRAEYKSKPIEQLIVIAPPKISNFKLLNQQIVQIDMSSKYLK